MHKIQLDKRWLSCSVSITDKDLEQLQAKLEGKRRKNVELRHSPAGELVGAQVGSKLIQVWDSEPHSSGIVHQGETVLVAPSIKADYSEPENGLVFRVDPFVARLKAAFDDLEDQEALRAEYGYFAPMVSPASGEVIGVQLGTSNYAFADMIK